MRLVLVHGRAQGDKSSELLRKDWLDALKNGIAATPGLPPLAETVDVRVPFYGAELDRLTETPPPGAFVARGGDAKPDAMEADLLLDLAERAGISEQEIAAEMAATSTDAYVERGVANWEWVQAAGRVLCRRVPWLSDVALGRFVRDVGAYLTRDDVRKVVDDIVRPHIEGDTAVVVGHSLGSVVAYAVLTGLGTSARVPLFVTVGSPLGIPVVKKYLPRPLGKPGGVTTWLNAADERDFVALYARLDRDTFPADIENLSDVHNGEHAHGIAGYLGDRVVAKRIAEAVSA